MGPALGLTITNGVATVNLSREFGQRRERIGAGRLAKVVYTLTQFSTVKSVTFELDDIQPVTTFSGEGVVLDHPVGRATTGPDPRSSSTGRRGARPSAHGPDRGPGKRLRSDLRVAVFDGSGTQLIDDQVMASWRRLLGHVRRGLPVQDQGRPMGHLRSTTCRPRTEPREHDRIPSG
jgi:hypothetical protein